MEILFLWFILLLIIPIILFRSWKSYKRKNELEELAISQIRFAASGKTRIQGYVWSDKIFLSPLFLDKIFYIKLSLFERGYDDSDVDTCVFKYKSLDPFYILDSSGIVVVKTVAKMDDDFVRRKTMSFSRLEQKAKDQIFALMSKRSVSLTEINFDRVYVVEESIAIAQPIVAIGVFNKKQNDINQFEQIVPTAAFDEFYQKTFRKYKSIKFIPDPKSLEIYGSLSGGEGCELFISPFTEEETLKKLGSSHYFGFVIGLLFYLLLLCPILLFIASILYRQ